MEDKRFELRAELVTVEISDPQTGEIFRSCLLYTSRCV